MTIASNTIDHVTLQHLVEAGAVRGADVVGQPGGWGVVVKYGMTERPLAARRGAIRLFSRFDTLVKYLKSMGISQFRVDASNYDGTIKKTNRPDSAVRMKRTFDMVKKNIEEIKLIHPQGDIDMSKIKYKDVIKSTHHEIFNEVIFNTKEELIKALKKEMNVYIKCMKNIETEFSKEETPSKRTIDYVNEQNRDLDQQIFVLDAMIHAVKKHEIKLPMQIIPNRRLLTQITAAMIDKWK